MGPPFGAVRGDSSHGVARTACRARTPAVSNAGIWSRGKLQCEGKPTTETFVNPALAASSRMHSATADVSLLFRYRMRRLAKLGDFACLLAQLIQLLQWKALFLAP